jgi:hypothetical protein
LLLILFLSFLSLLSHFLCVSGSLFSTLLLSLV